MNPDQLPTIGLCAIAVALLYLAIRYLFLRFASAELSAGGARREGDAIQIYAQADSLEYYLRLAVAASDTDRLTIIVNIPKNDEQRNEMKATVRMMRRRHKNIFYRMT